MYPNLLQNYLYTNFEIQKQKKWSKLLPTDIHSGIWIVHLPRLFRATASHSGTLARLGAKQDQNYPNKQENPQIQGKKKKSKLISYNQNKCYPQIH